VPTPPPYKVPTPPPSVPKPCLSTFLLRRDPAARAWSRAPSLHRLQGAQSVCFFGAQKQNKKGGHTRLPHRHAQTRAQVRGTRAAAPPVCSVPLRTMERVCVRERQ
jgi:hypothetical protein